MHRRLVPLLLVLAFVALGASSGSSASILCPEQAGSHCCSPPTGAADVPPNDCCPQTCCPDTAQTCQLGQVSISSRPDPSVEGRPVTISGRVFGAAAGQTVYLWQKLPGQAGFRRVAQATTGAAGAYTIVRGAGAIQMNRTWYVTAGAGTSPTLVQHVSALIGLSASPGHPGAGHPVTFSGHVAPSHAGERVVLQQHAAKGWTRIARGTLGPKSRFVLHHKFAHKGVAMLRVLLAADALNTQSASAPVRVSVR